MARNKLASENTKLSKQEIVSLVVKKTRAWQAANQRKIAPTPRPTDSKLSLSTPMLAKTQCFVDEVWISATNIRGFEWLFKDPLPGSTRSMSSNRRHVGSKLIAEVLAVKFSLLDAVSLGLNSVILWSDSRTRVHSSQICLQRRSLSTSKSFFKTCMSFVDHLFLSLLIMSLD